MDSFSFLLAVFCGSIFFVRRKYISRNIGLLALLMTMAANANATVSLSDLRCEFMVDPVGINADSPRLSWKLKSNAQNEKQTAFEVLAASSEALLTPEKADLYSSGKIEGDWSHLFPYVGKRPDGLEKVFWKVRVWDKNGEVSEWSPTASWSYGPDSEADWKNAQWISMDTEYLSGQKAFSRKGFAEKAQWIWTEEGVEGKPQNFPAGVRYFRKAFSLPSDKKVKSAFVVITADDAYDCYFNGKLVGKNHDWKSNTYAWREPGGYDLTKVITSGENVISVAAENGRDGYAALAAIVEVIFEDGTSLQIPTDNTWQSCKDKPTGWGSAQLTQDGWGKTVAEAKIGASPWTDMKVGVNLPNLPALMFRKEFSLDPNKKVVSAVAHITGLGLFELYLNGDKVGDHVLDHAVTDYMKTILYQSFDITKDLVNGKNAVGVILGNGRYTNPRVGKHYGQPVTRALLRIQYDDGSIQEVITDESWQATEKGPIRFNNEFDGETYDARMELPGWNKVGYDASKWEKAVKLDSGKIAPGKVQAQMMPPIRVTTVLTPKSVTRTDRGTYIVDMGQNMVGWCKIKVKGSAGTEIKLVHAETLKPDGTLYMDNLRSAKVTDRYILKGGTTEVYEPRFIYHGFRFVEVYNYPGSLTVGDITGCVVHDDLDQIGTFETSNAMVNHIAHNIFWGTRGNYRSMPTDCPQRDERLGWLGDRAAECRGEGLLFNIAPLYAKWLRDMADSQEEDGSVSDVSPNYWVLYNDDVTWPSATVIIPEMLYDLYGDAGVIAEHYPSMKKWMDLMQTYVTEDGVIEKDTYGDWCCPPESPELIHSKDPLRQTAKGVLATTYFYGNLRLMEKYAKLLNKNDDAKVWAQRADAMKEAFIKKYYNAEKKCFDNGSQTSSVLPLFFDMVPAGEKEAVFNQLIDKIMVHTKGHIGTGLVGAQYLNRVLSDNGRPDISWKLATNTDYPSWGYMVEHDATTIWELWNGDTANPGMNSHNHVMLVGDLNVWFYQYLGGIKPAAPGYKEITLQPYLVDGLDYVKCSQETPYGKVVSNWKRNGQDFVWDIDIPANTTATVKIPDGNTQILGSGKYTIKAVLK